MTKETYTVAKPYTIDQLITEIYNQNSIHFDFDEDMNGGGCDCALHTTIKTIIQYWGE